MYACKQCGTHNSLDGSFCKKCGAALPEAELLEAREKLQTLVAEGNDLFTQGRTEEAMLIAEAAATADPSSHAALSLKGLCHERLGEVAEALECYEAAVALNPDGALDKLKVAALRNRLAARVADAPPPSRRGAAIAATSAAVFVVVMGTLISMSLTPHDPPRSALNAPSGQASGFDPAAAQQPNAATNQPQGAQSGGSGAQTAPGQAGGSSTGLPTDPNRAYNPITTDPTQNGGGLPSGDNPYAPLVLQPSGSMSGPIGAAAQSGTAAPVQSGRSNGPADPPPAIDTGQGPATPPAAKPPDDGIIEIQRAHGAHANGGSESVDANGQAALAKTASENYQLGRYRNAADAYERLAGSGGDSGQVQQRLGRCYVRLGDSGRAVQAFRRAVQLFSTQTSPSRTSQAAIQECQQELKVLGAH